MIRKIIKKILYSGTTYQCPLCGYRCRDWAYSGVDAEVNSKLDIIGAGRRKNVCHQCGSNDRERLVIAFLNEQLKSQDWTKIAVLHIAPEYNLSRWIAQQQPQRYIQGDRHMEGYQYPAAVQHMDITQLPFETNTFDWVICNHVLEHIEDDKKAMDEIYRVLKPRGSAVLQVPISLKLDKTYENKSIQTPDEREQHFGQRDHVRIYGPDYVQRLKEVGFEVNRQKIKSENNWGLNPLEDVFWVRR